MPVFWEMMASDPPLGRTPATWRALEEVGGRLAVFDAPFRADVLARISDGDGDVCNLLVRVIGATRSEDAAVALLDLPDLVVS